MSMSTTVLLAAEITPDREKAVGSVKLSWLPALSVTVSVAGNELPNV